MSAKKDVKSKSKLNTKKDVGSWSKPSTKKDIESQLKPKDDNIAYASIAAKHSFMKKVYLIYFF